MGSVNLITTSAQPRGTAQAVSLCQRRYSVTQEVKHSWRHETVIDTARSHSSHQCVVSPTCVCVLYVCFCCTACVCVRSFSVCHAPLPPPVYLAHFLHRLPPRYFMSESFYSSHLRTHFRLLNVSICGGSDTHSLTPQGTYP